MHNVLVCGYGCHLTTSLRWYLDFVARRLCSSDDVNLVIASGGYNNQRTAPGIREADLVRDYLVSVGVRQPIIRETEAVTSMENLRLSEAVLRSRGNGEIPLVIYCDSIRMLKVAYMAKRIFRCPVEVVGYDFSRSLKEKMAQCLFLTPVEIAAFHMPALEKKLRAYRLKQNQAR